MPMVTDRITAAELASMPTDELIEFKVEPVMNVLMELGFLHGGGFRDFVAASFH